MNIVDKIYCRTLTLRGLLFRNLFKSVGKNFRLGAGCIIHSHENISIGNNITIGDYAFFEGAGEIEIKDNVQIAPHVSILSSDHNYADKNKLIKEQGFKYGKVTIESNVWLGTNVVILKGVTIGKNSVVGSGAVVTKSVKENCIVAGVPAKIIKELR